MKTNDPVRLSFLVALLTDAGIEAIVLDAYASAMDGSIGAIPRRLAVPDGDGPAALRLLPVRRRDHKRRLHAVTTSDGFMPWT